MNAEKICTRKNPREDANFLSKLFVCWTLDIYKKGVSHKLQLRDIYQPLKSDESERLSDQLEREWSRELAKFKGHGYSLETNDEVALETCYKPTPSLARVLLKVFWRDNVAVAFMVFVQAMAITALPLFEESVLSYFDKNSLITENTILYYGLGIVLCDFISMLTFHQSYLTAQHIGLKMKVACTSLIYRKILHTEKSSLNKSTVGQIMNLISNDVSRFDNLIFFMYWSLISALQVLLIAYITWRIAGYAAVIGITCLILLSTPSHIIIGKLSNILRNRISVITDKRIQLMNDLVSAMQVIKMYAWEIPFAEMVTNIRTEEMKQIRLLAYIKGFVMSSILITDRIAIYVTAISYTLMRKVLKANVTFVLLMYYNILQATMNYFVPSCFIIMGEAIISLKRIKQFLLLTEVNRSKTNALQNVILHDMNKNADLKEEIITKAKVDEECKPVEVELYKVYANWINGQLPPTLHNVTMKVKRGQLCAIVGLVGSGKTALLNVLLRELPIQTGVVSIRQNDESSSKNLKTLISYVTDNSELRISYASQDAWLFSGTIRDNILFGNIFDECRYKEVTEVCALRKDFMQLPNGDMTTVGERGATLSGGQRARINLARAIYKRSDLYLLDDPLSSVDNEVSQHLFQRCIVDFLSGTTRILITHQLQFLDRVDTVVLMEKGTVIRQGSYTNLINSDSIFSQFISYLNMKEKKEVASDLKESYSENSTSVERQLRKRIFRRNSTKSNTSEYNVDHDFKTNNQVEETNEEALEHGIVKGKIFKAYFRAGGSRLYLTFLTIFLILSQVCNSGSDYWISYWMNVNFIRDELKKGEISKEKVDSFANNTILSYFGLDEYGLLPNLKFIYIYTFLLSTVIITNVARSMCCMKVCTRASLNLHNSMFVSVLRAPIQFFTTNISGKILNRFSKDVGAMDEILPLLFLEVLQGVFTGFGAMIMVVVVNYWLIIPVVITLTLLYYARKILLDTTNELKRYEIITKSPIFSHISTTLNGLATIRSGGKYSEAIVKKQFDVFQDIHTGANYLAIAATTTVCLFVDMLINSFNACVIFTVILTKSENTLSGSIGLAILQTLMLSGMVQHSLRQSTEVLSYMTSVERVVQYSKLPQESPLETSDPLPSIWPSEGRLIFKKVFMRYRENDPPVLKDINVTVEPGWKVGIVGRTGAGKSSLISALFRLTGDKLEGSIIIDGRDTATIGLWDLRSRISIIPQIPILFSKTLRYNLDPFGTFTDSELWDVLRKVELSNVSLDQQVSDGGTNFSVGERQLICLARAILRNNRILVLDEATASIDSCTDALIQKTIRDIFTNCTVLTIAHRLNTVIDSDRIIVMDDGRIVEFGHPYELLHDNPNGHFSKMVKELGATVTQELIIRAKSNHENAK